MRIDPVCCWKGFETDSNKRYMWEITFMGGVALNAHAPEFALSDFNLGRMPAQMFIDKSGMIRYVHYGHSMADIPSNEEMLTLIKKLNL